MISSGMFAIKISFITKQTSEGGEYKEIKLLGIGAPVERTLADFDL